MKSLIIESNKQFESIEVQKRTNLSIGVLC